MQTIREVYIVTLSILQFVFIELSTESHESSMLSSSSRAFVMLVLSTYFALLYIATIFENSMDIHLSAL